MKKFTVILLSILFSSGIVFAQDDAAADTVKNWQTGGRIGLTFNQVALSNWAAGGENSFSGNTEFRVFANYKKDKNAWDNSMVLAYGLVKQETRNINKNDDRIEIISKYGRQAGEKWYYAGEFTARSQFAEGYNTPEDSLKLSDFLSPGYITLSLGMDYKPHDNFSLMLSPLTSKFTIVMDDSLSSAGAFGVDPGENFRSELGGYIKVMYKKPGVVKNVDFATNLDLFSNYMDNPDKIDVNWEMFLDMKVNDFLTASIKTHLIYDYDIKFVDEDSGVEEDKIQFKEAFGFGITYKF